LTVRDARTGIDLAASSLVREDVAGFTYWSAGGRTPKAVASPVAYLLPNYDEYLIPIVHEELHRIARAYMAGEGAGHSLQATALVNEAYLRLIEGRSVNWQNRAHFLAVASRLMRRILVDFARAKRYQKRGGGAVRVTLANNLPVSDEPGRDLVALNDALDALAKHDERKGRVIEMRFFGGLSVKETAEALHVSPETVMRDWKLAKAWLLKELRSDISGTE
jgi:RNA polymerase sigma factor (TIGR02999 family)